MGISVEVIGAEKLQQMRMAIEKLSDSSLQQELLEQTVGSHTRQMNIPQREYLGLSTANSDELMHVIGDFWSEVLP